MSISGVIRIEEYAAYGVMNYRQMSGFEQLYQAHLKSRRGKRNQKEVIDFEMNLGWNLTKLRGELMSGTYKPKPYKEFRIYDPKERIIHALQYRDRIVQHTLCDNVIAPYMERHLIYDNAASRKEKGTHFAMDRLSGFLRSYYNRYGNSGYFLKFDIRKFYDSIDHDILFSLIENAFGNDKEVCGLIWKYIDSYHTGPGKGIPMGNQSSQWFALYYLDRLDRIIKEKFKIRYYSRYMDDGILIHHNKTYIKECLEYMGHFLAEERKLEFNEKTQIIPLAQGADYLGFHFYLIEQGKVIRKLRTSNKKRIKKKLKSYRHAYRIGKMDYEAVKRSIVSYKGHLSHGNTYHLQKQLLSHLVLSKQTEQERKKYDKQITG